MIDAYNGRVATAMLLAVLALAVLVLAGCRPEEQARPLAYQKGVYMGAADTSLSAATLDELRIRAQRQSYN